MQCYRFYCIYLLIMTYFTTICHFICFLYPNVNIKWREMWQALCVVATSLTLNRKRRLSVSSSVIHKRGKSGLPIFPKKRTTNTKWNKCK